MPASRAHVPAIFLLALSLLWFPVDGRAQIVNVGSERTLDIATWNIEWMGAANNGPSDPAMQVQNVADIINGSGIDLWAVQEIVFTTDTANLENLIPSYWEGSMATVSGAQHIGFWWDSRVLQLRSVTHILQSYDYEFAGRPPLKAEFNVTLPDTSFIATFITVHMKCCASTETDYLRRVEAAKRLKNHIDFAGLATEPVFILGDFNDEMTASTWSGLTSPYQIFLDDPDDYSVLTWPLEQAGGASHQSGSFLDHIVVTNEADDLLLTGSPRVLTNLTTVNSFYARTSDHLPVMASFGPATVTSTEEPSVPSHAILTALYPNPAYGRVSLEVDPSQTDVRIELIDVLGRIHSSTTLQPGRHDLDLPDAPGLWWIRAYGRSGVENRPLLVTDRPR